MCPDELIEVEELPERWGLLTVTSRGAIKAIRGPVTSLAKHSGAYRTEPRFQDACVSWAQPSNMAAERDLLVLLLNRVGDSEKLNLMLREASGRATRGWQEVERLRERLRSAEAELLEARMAAAVAQQPPELGR